MSSTIFDCYQDHHQNPLEKFTSFIECNQIPLEQKTVYINSQIYHEDALLEETDVIIRLARKNWCYIQNTILNNTTVSHNELATIREETVKCLQLILKCLKDCDNDMLQSEYLSSTLKQFETFRQLVLPVADLDDTTFLKLSSTSHNKDKCPTYQYFHTFLDVQYCFLLLYHVSGYITELKNHINLLIRDLITLSEKSFEHNHKSAFLCNCCKDLWLMIQLLCEKTLDDESFWSLFNTAVEGINGTNDRFILWLLRDIANLHVIGSNGNLIGCLSERIKPNFTLLESSLKNLVTKVDSKSSILPTLKTVETLACGLWLKSSKIEIYQILWEYFSKRLNTSTRSSKNLTMVELVELMDTILWTPKDCDEDFELFLSMLAVHLNEHPYHWGKMKGRIYSQLGPNKVKDLNSTGLYHVLLLFVTLTRVSFDELSKKFVQFIDNLPSEKRKTTLIWNFYMSFIVRHVRENRSIEFVAPSLIKMTEEASNDHYSSHLLKIFVTNFDNVIKSSLNLQLHQWLLIDTWIHKYMTTCHYPDLISLLNVLLSTIDQINSEQVWCEWELPFKNYVYPTLKFVANSKSAPESCGTLAAKIVVLCPSLSGEAFSFFNSESIIPKVTSSFLCVILDSYPNAFMMSQQQEIVALQSWIKICLLTRDNYEQLTRNIGKLDVVPGFIKSAISTAKDPLFAFIDCLAQDIEKHVQSPPVLKFCEYCFAHVERWINQYFTQSDSEASVLRIYTCTALAFYKIGSLLYNKHKANCPYTRLMSSIVLPTEIMIGRSLNPHVLQGIKKTWHLIFEATIKLNTPNDAFIQRTLRELVVKYVPHFAVVDSPMLKCLDNEATAEEILDKMSNAFFKHPTKEAESNVHKSLRIVNEFVQGTTSTSSMKIVVNKTLYGLFEVIMFHNQRNMALSVVKNVTQSPLYSHVRMEFEETIVAITEKHLAFYTPNYFQLMGVLVKFVGSSVKILIPRIKQQVANVERMRGVGFDKNLRLSLERLEASLNQV